MSAYFSLPWLIPAIASLLAIAFAVVAMAYRDVRSPRWAAAGLGAMALASAIDLAHPHPTGTSLWLAGSGHWIAAGCVLQAMLERHHRSLPQNLVLIGVAIMAPLHAWSIFPADMGYIRSIVVNAGAFGLFALAFIRSSGTALTVLDRILRGLVGIGLLLYPIRVFVFLMSPSAPGGNVMLSDHMTMLFVAVGVLGFGFSLTLLLATGADIINLHRRESELDPLTGIANRRALDREIAACEKNGGCGAVLLVDLDHFKDVNDKYGHEFGDKVLIAVARELEAKMAGFGIVARAGGEEFIILLDRCGADASGALALAARQAIAAIILPPPHDELRITASVGVAHHMTGEPFSETIRTADIAMYQAKAAGRDRAYAAARANGLLELRSVA
ncbi:MAG: GGDEF domain-containing protein [Sphingomonadales bacterium]|nr:GGDEF domain-containing protein [Sphingomonadales bacterium]